jgi:hypothetical protein
MVPNVLSRHVEVPCPPRLADWSAGGRQVMTMVTLEAMPKSWYADEIHRIVAAARMAPRWGVPDPWTLEFRGRGVSVYRTPGEDSDRLLACGAALTNVRLAIRTAGFAALVRFPIDEDRPDLVAQVFAGDPLSPTPDETDQYAVINGFHPVVAGDPREVLMATWCASVEVRSAGSGELLVLTPDDSYADRVRAGAATQSLVLATMIAGVPVDPPVNLAHDHEARAALIERLALAGYPQVRLYWSARAGH